MTPREVREERNKEIIRRYRAGEKVEDIIRDVAGGSSETVYRVLRQEGIELRRPEMARPVLPSPSFQERLQRDQEIIRRYLAGEKVVDIVREVAQGSYDVVYRALHTQGVALRNIKPSDLPFYLRRISAELGAGVLLKDWERIKKAIANLQRFIPP